MPQVWSDINWALIITLLFGSGLIAYLGDILGTRFGKKRISIFGLRPRHTSSLVTAITGILIAFLILFALSVTSDTVRTALFSMKYLQRQINDLTLELQESRDESELLSLRIIESREKLSVKEEQLQDVSAKLAESIPRLEQTREAVERLEKEKDSLESTIAELREEAELLRKGLEEVRGGKIALFANEMLVQIPVLPGSSEGNIKELLQRMYQRAKFLIAARLETDMENISLKIDYKTEAAVIDECVNSEERKFVRLLVASNILVGEPVNIKFQVRRSDIIYPADKVLVTRTVYPPYTETEAEAILHAILRQVNSFAVKEGLLPDPVNGTVGSVDATDFFEAVNTLSTINEISSLEISTTEEIYSEGPLNIMINIVPLKNDETGS